MFNSQFKWQFMYENVVKTEAEIMKILYKNRNLVTDKEISRFLSETISLHDPYLFRDMKKIVMRIQEAIEKQEKIMIYGDFDVDGVTSVTILYKVLKKLQANVFYYIPNRFTEGYGPNKKVFETFYEHDFSLIITVDNGITGVLEAQYLKSVGIDLIITDHHEEKEVLPEAYAILHPKIKTETYPFKDLSGCGVSLKLAHALLGEIPYDLIDLAALGTYSDMVPLLDENRMIVKWGLKQLAHTKHLGLRLLQQAANIKEQNEYALGFIYGPRLNAPGRMDRGQVAVRLLTTEDYREASGLVEDIESLNQDRRAKIDSIVDEAIEEINQNHLDDYHVIVVEKSDWHEGVLGIICNRLINIYHKPIIVLTESHNIYKGSARTLEDFPLNENLEKCVAFLETYGGHKMAAGLSIKKENIEPFRKRLHELAGAKLHNYLKIDCIIDEQLISMNLTKNIQNLRPFGVDNQNPLFLLKNYEIIACQQIGNGNKHLKLQLRKESCIINAIAFNKGHLFYQLNHLDTVDVVGAFELNEFNRQITNQLLLEDIRCCEKQVFDYRNKPFDETKLSFLTLTYLYFEDDYGYQNAIQYNPDKSLGENIVLIDLPPSLDIMRKIMRDPHIQNIYALFKCEDLFSHEHLVTRQKLGRIYQVYRKFKQFKIDDKHLEEVLFKMGFNKNIQKISLQVFFELNFVIIKDNQIIVVENPEKRQLNESKTFERIHNQIEVKDKLILSSQMEFRNLLKKIL